MTLLIFLCLVLLFIHNGDILIIGHIVIPKFLNQKIVLGLFLR